MSIWDDSVVYGAGQQYGGQVEFSGDVESIEITSPDRGDIVYREKYINLAGNSIGDKFHHGIRATIDNKTYYGKEPVNYGGSWIINNMYLGNTSGTKTIYVELYKLDDDFTIAQVTFDVIVECDPPWELHNYPLIDWMYEHIPEIYRRLDKEISQGKPVVEQYPLRQFLRCLMFEFISIKEVIERITEITDIDNCPEGFIVHIAKLIRAKINPLASVDYKRNQVKTWVAMLKVKGTRIGIATYIRNATGWTAIVQAGDPYIFRAYDGATPDPTTYDCRCMTDSDISLVGTPSDPLYYIWGRGGYGPAFIEIYLYGTSEDSQKALKDELLHSTLDSYIPAGSGYKLYYVN